jgi:hypothetical protein
MNLSLVFEQNAFVTKSRENAFTHSLKKRMAAAATVAKAGSGATVKFVYFYKYSHFLLYYVYYVVLCCAILYYVVLCCISSSFILYDFRLRNVVLNVIILK